jgi:predicted amidohydrolase
MRLGFVQTSPRVGETHANLEQAWELIGKVREADLVVLPELFHSGYAVRNRDEAEYLSITDGEKSDTLGMCLDACRTFGMTIVAGILEREGKILYNSAWLIGAEGVKAKYRKIHLFNLEKEIFAAGEKISPITLVKGKKRSARVGMMVCFDWIFPEGWGELAWGGGAGKGAQIVAHPANLVIPEACPHSIRTRAMENRIFIVTAGRTGSEAGPDGEIEFVGGSRIVGPDGTILAAGADDRPGCDMVEINPEWADDKFVTPGNDILRERFGRLEEE